LLKYLPQKRHSTVDWAQWPNNTAAQKGPAPRSCIGPAPVRAGPDYGGAKSLRGRRKVPTVSQVLSSIQQICFRKSSDSTMGAPNLLFAPGAI